MKNTFSSQTTFLPWWILLLCNVFVIYKYVLQVSLSSITSIVMQDFQMDGISAGHLSAAFLYALVVTQFFVGYLLDSYNPFRLISVALALCSVGAVGLACSHHLYSALLSRAFMGIGGAFAAASYFKVASILLAPHAFSFASGLLATAVTLGIITGQVPFLQLINYYGWRFVLAGCSMIGVLLMVLFFALSLRYPRKQLIKKETDTHSTIQWIDVKYILQNPQNWLLAFYNGLAFSPLGLFSGTWGVAFLQQSNAINSTYATLLSACIFLGFGFGSPIIGFLSDQYDNKKSFMLIGNIIALFITYCLLYYSFSTFTVSVLLFVLGVATGPLMLGFSLGKDINATKTTATLITFLNTGGVMITAITEPVIGKLLDFYQREKMITEITLFTTEAYRFAFSLLPFYLLFSVILVVFIREPLHRRQDQ